MIQYHYITVQCSTLVYSTLSLRPNQTTTNQEAVKIKNALIVQLSEKLSAAQWPVRGLMLHHLKALPAMSHVDKVTT